MLWNKWMLLTSARRSHFTIMSPEDGWFIKLSPLFSEKARALSIFQLLWKFLWRLNFPMPWVDWDTILLLVETSIFHVWWWRSSWLHVSKYSAFHGWPKWTAIIPLRTPFKNQICPITDKSLLVKVGFKVREIITCMNKESPKKAVKWRKGNRKLNDEEL